MGVTRASPNCTTARPLLAAHPAPPEISNHPEVIRRFGCPAMNGMIEADIYVSC